MAPRNTHGTPTWLGAVNDRVGLAALIDEGPLTRNRICELVGVSKPTASSMMTRLLNIGVVAEHGSVAGYPGRNAALYAARLDRVLGVAIAIDAHEMQATVVDAAGSERPIVRIPLSELREERSAPDEVLRAIDLACEAVDADPATVNTVCIGTAGYVDPGRDGTLFSETLPGWPTSHVRETLEAAVGRTIAVENDVNLAAHAERVLGAGIDEDVFAILWLGNGVGAAFDIGGDLHRGSFGGAGEIGYLPVSADAAVLDPEAVDVQDLVGGTAVTRVARAHGLQADAQGDALAAIAAAPADVRASVVDELGLRIAHGVLPLIATLDPGLLVLAGPTAAVGGEPLARAVERGIRSLSRWYPRVAATHIPDNPVLLGARAAVQARVREELLDGVARLTVD